LSSTQRMTFFGRMVLRSLGPGVVWTRTAWVVGQPAVWPDHLGRSWRRTAGWVAASVRARVQRRRSERRDEALLSASRVRIRAASGWQCPGFAWRRIESSLRNLAKPRFAREGWCAVEGSARAEAQGIPTPQRQRDGGRSQGSEKTLARSARSGCGCRGKVRFGRGAASSGSRSSLKSGCRKNQGKSCFPEGWARRLVSLADRACSSTLPNITEGNPTWQ